MLVGVGLFSTHVLLAIVLISCISCFAVLFGGVFLFHSETERESDREMGGGMR